MIRLLLTILAIGLMTAPAQAANTSFSQWITQFRADAQNAGIRTATLDQAFRGMTPNERVLELDRKQPEGTMTLEQYLDRIVSKTRIEKGQELYLQHKELLDKVGKRYGVQPRYIVALWGIESNFGSNMGGFSTVEALATLAYDGRRADFFRKELINALKIIDQERMSPDELKGSWAGALGQSQFMPSSYLSYAQDFDGDGKRDIWGNQADVFASIANYLARRGWDDSITWGREVTLPNQFDMAQEGRKVKKPIPEWQRLGVRRPDGGDLPSRALPASVVVPKSSARAFLTYSNYDVIMKWNRSIYFATAVGKLSDKIAGR